MPITVSWLVENRVILLQNLGAITVEDLHKTDDAVLPMLDSSTHSLVHIMVDDRKQISVPRLNDMAKIKYVRHSRVGWVISQEKNPLSRMIGAIVGSMMKIRFRYVDDLDAGLKFLSDVDSTLPDIDSLRQRLNEETGGGVPHKG